MLFKIIDSTSPSCGSTALNIFQTKGTMVAINNSLWHEILTLNPLDNPPYHFHISAGDGFLDLSKTYLKTEFKLQKYDETAKTWGPIVATDKVSVNQALGATWIRNVKCSINQREIFNSNSLYSYKAFIDMELSHTDAYKETYLQSAGYYKDDGLPTVTTGKGFIARQKPFLKGENVEFISKLFVDLFQNDLYFINGCSIDVEISPHSQDYNIITTADDKTKYRLVLESCKLYVKSVFLMDGLNLEMAAKIETEPARYSIVRTELKSLMITEGHHQFNANIFQEQVPRRLTIALIKYNYFNGESASSPFIFEPHSVKDISIRFNDKTFPNVNYKLDFTNRNYVRAFHDMYENLGFLNTTESNGISLEDFQSRLCFFVFNLTNSQDTDQCFDLIKSGTTSVHINFSKNVPSGGLAMLIYAEFDGMIIVDKNRVVTTDLTI